MESKYLNIKALLLLSLLGFASRSDGYPQLINKGYINCQSCHITASGGTLLNNYGRAVSGEISTWSVEDEALEFGWTENEFIDYKFRYRHLTLTTPDEIVNIPMLFDYECAYHNKGLTLNLGWGFYGRDRLKQSRSSFAQFKFTRWFHVRGGYFLPTYGIGTNDHTLKIKRNLGLGRGQEKYNIEAYFLLRGWSRLFLTASAPAYRLSSVDTGLVELITPYETTEYRLKWGIFPTKKSEVGFSAYGKRTGPEVFGLYGRLGFFKESYALFEYDYNRIFDDQVIYGRLGTFIYRGIDLFGEFDSYRSANVQDDDFLIGINWNIRPRFNISFKINFDRTKYDQYQTYVWF